MKYESISISASCNKFTVQNKKENCYCIFSQMILWEYGQLGEIAYKMLSNVNNQECKGREF